jgi:hypothetical protein
MELQRNAARGRLQAGTIALIKGGHKLIHYFGYPDFQDGYELFDLTDDPEELQDVSLSQPSILAELTHELQEKLNEVNAQQGEEL